MLISNQKGYSREKVGRPFDPGAYLYVGSTRATWIPLADKEIIVSYSSNEWNERCGV
jgi:hypothetical protein